ncbi:unnamed protein product, partial [Effrenium voratum]
MPLPSGAKSFKEVDPELKRTIDRAEKELQGACDGLASLGRELRSIRAAAGAPEPSSGSWLQPAILQDPPALALHQLQKANQVPAAARFRRISSRGGEGQLRLHGRWMELSTLAADTVVKEKSKTKLGRSTTSDELFKTRAEMRSSFVLHPQGAFRLCWDILALLLLLNDSLSLPPAIAWDLSMDSDVPSSVFLRVFFFISLGFWSSDIVINLSTAVYVKGTLAVGRRDIFWAYASSWMLFDVVILSIDLILLCIGVGASDLQVLRIGRILRMIRLMRILKLSKLNSMIEENAASAGRQWVTLVVAITKTAVGMLVCAHFLTCFWFWVGTSIGSAGQANWITIAGADSVPGWVQYLHALRWIMNAPSPPDIDPASGVERAIDIVMAATTLVVIGSAISKISGTMAELRAMNEESDRKRRDVRIYLAGQAVSFELVTRIMRFVEYKLEKVSANTLDSALISPNLQLELYVSQRADFLGQLPIFALAQQCYPEVFGVICKALTKNFCEKGEPVFIAGAFAAELQITATGRYQYSQELAEQPVMLEGTHWFGELSLFCDTAVHYSTLTPETIAETYSLTGADLVDCIKPSRGCTSLFCEYAKDFVAAMQKTSSKFGDADQVEQGQVCCKLNRHFQAAYPDPATLFTNVVIAAPLENAEVEVETDDANLVNGNSPHPHEGDLPEKNRSSQSVLTKLASNSNPVAHAAAETSTDPGLSSLVDEITSQEVLEAEKLPAKLQQVIPELNPDYGTHVVYGQPAERDRGESSCISVIALLKNDYDLFTQPQAPPVKLKDSQWLELQEILAWIEPDPKELEAVLVLLSIRGLGKSKTILQQLPADLQRPERAVVHLCQRVQNVVPSASWLSQKSLHLVEETLATHELFNLAQMLQGENCPASVKELRVHIEEKGDASFRFYIFFLLGFMSGLAAGQGSRFMNAKNADATIGGIRVLQRLMSVEPTAIYWGYLALRADKLALPFDSPEDLVLVRLACLARVQDQKGYELLRRAWHELGLRERRSLTDHFLADGIQEQAFVLEFLPNCVASAQANKLIGLTCLLDVLTDILSCLRAK